MNVGVVGLGRMGAAIAARLLDRGFPLVVWNRSRSRATALEARGAKQVLTPAGAAAVSDIVVTMLADDEAARAVYLGKNGLCSPAAAGRLFIEMSTLRPETVRELHEKLHEHGAAMIDAPVSGTVGPAREGRLLALVGGEEKDLRRAEPVLSALTRRVVHAGPAGQGALLKLAVNLPLAVYWQSLAESVAIGEAGGLERKTIVETLADSAAALAVLNLKLPAILGESAEVAFDLASMQKDLRLITGTAETLGIDTVAARAALRAYGKAVDAGLGDDDAATIVAHTELRQRDLSLASD